jgi:radical SAM superfamily enzyme YgiQ (UPF0313 family)
MKIGDFLSKLQRRREETRLDVLLIHADSFYNLAYSLFNLGLLSIATVLKEQGFRVMALSNSYLFNTSPGELEYIARTESPRLVGFYTLSDNLPHARAMARFFKEHVPDVRIVVGGPLATVLGPKMLDEESFDFVAVGEGEQTASELAGFVARGEGDVTAIRGLVWRRGAERVVNPPRPPIEDLDSLPFPDRDLIGVKHGFHVSTGRGCPHQCIFCFQEVHGRRYRYRSARNVAREIIENVRKYGARTVYITDDTFVVNIERTRSVCESLTAFRKDSGADFIFFCEGRVDIFCRHLDILKTLKDAGMARLQIGMESGDPEMLKAYHKHIRPDQVEEVVRACHDLGGISVCGNFILGGPHETERSFERTVELAERLVAAAPGTFEASCSFMCPYPGTSVASNLDAMGYRIVDDGFEKGLTLSDVHLETESLDTGKMRALEEMFSTRLLRAMRKNAKRLSPESLEHHFRWAREYRMHTSWYQRLLMGSELFENYFMFKVSTRFRAFKEIPPDEFILWRPMRTIEKRIYRPDGRMLLPGWFTKLHLSNPGEILAYEYSSGKLTAGEIAERLARELGTSPLEAQRRIMEPLYRRLERTQHIIFYR